MPGGRPDLVNAGATNRSMYTTFASAAMEMLVIGVGFKEDFRQQKQAWLRTDKIKAVR
jgi:hypothetical protein